MEEGHREFVILDFKKYWPDDKYGASEFQELVDMIQDSLGPWLLTDAMLPGPSTATLEERLHAMRLGELVGDSGHLLIANGEVNHLGSYVDPSIGLWNADLVEGDGSYSNKDKLAEMEEKQRENWRKADGPRFQLWWTLTCQPGGFDCSVRELAAEANPELPAFVDSMTIPNPFGTLVNEIWVDFAEETAATEIAIRLNPVAALIDVKPGNARNVVNPNHHGALWVAVLSDPDSLTDALQVDPESVRLGNGNSSADRFKVRDLNGDGLADLEFRFSVHDAGMKCGDTTVTVHGETYDGQRFIGIDTIEIAGCKGQRKGNIGKQKPRKK
jgi:hypothetical protein